MFGSKLLVLRVDRGDSWEAASISFTDGLTTGIRLRPLESVRARHRNAASHDSQTPHALTDREDVSG